MIYLLITLQVKKLWGYIFKRNSKRVLEQDARYTILIIRGDEGVHAIGMYRKYSMVGESKAISLFDSNQGKLTAAGLNDVSGFSLNKSTHKSQVLC
jgi:hypothetical protein